MTNINIIHLPWWGEDNPYQKQLSGNLQELGLNVRLENCRTFFLSTVIRQWKADILHFHWLDSFYRAPYTAKSLVRLVLFIMQLYLLRMVGVKIVWTVHNIKSHYECQILLERLCNILVARLSHKIIVHCETAIKEVAGAFRVENTKKII